MAWVNDERRVSEGLESTALLEGAAQLHMLLLAICVNVPPACAVLCRAAGGMREMAALLLGRLLTRPDMAHALRDFMAWADTAMDTVGTLRAPFLVPGGRGGG